jgi:hypothetical protein
MTASQREESFIVQRCFDEAYDTASTIVVRAGCFQRATRDDGIPTDDTFETCIDIPDTRCQSCARSRR